MKSQLETHEEQHNDPEEFQSMSGKSSDIEEEAKQVQLSHPKNYSLSSISFPPLDPKTTLLYSMYQQNNTLITNLKQQISRLQHIKQQSVYLSQQPPLKAVYTSISQYFLTCQETYDKRQLQLLKLKNDIKKIDTEQVRILMARNDNIVRLAESYFEEFRRVVDARTYEEGIVLLTEQKKRNHKKKKQPTIEEQVSNISLEHNQSNTKSSSSNIKPRKQQKPRPKYMIRFIHYFQIFSELSTSNNNSLIEKVHYIIPLTSEQAPISLAYSHKLKLIFILLKSGSICAFTLTQHDSTSSVHDNRSSHKTQQIYSKLSEIPLIKIDFDSRAKIINWEIRESKLYVLTLDSLLRVYDIVLKDDKVQSLKLVNMIYCQNQEKEAGSIADMCFSPLNPQDLLLITNKSHLCKFNITKLKSQVLYTYNQQLLSLNPFYLQASDKIFLSTQNFDPIETKLIEKAKLLSITSAEGKKQPNQELKILCLLRNQRVYVIRVEKHGLLTGVELDLEAISPQVEIIQTIIEEQ